VQDPSYIYELTIEDMARAPQRFEKYYKRFNSLPSQLLLPRFYIDIVYVLLLIVLLHL
jgi:hypothetical protein